MSVARVLLLVLLAAVLPVRGAMAAALLCPPAAGATGEAHASHGPRDGGHDLAVTGSHLHNDHAAGHHRDGDTGHDRCNLCAACCSVPPLASAWPDLASPHAAAAAFPELSAPTLPFVSDGPERPPRSI